MAQRFIFQSLLSLLFLLEADGLSGEEWSFLEGSAVGLTESLLDGSLDPADCFVLKSVAYQPVPFSWKPAAEIKRTAVSLKHLGH